MGWRDAILAFLFFLFLLGGGGRVGKAARGFFLAVDFTYTGISFRLMAGEARRKDVTAVAARLAVQESTGADRQPYKWRKPCNKRLAAGSQWERNLLGRKVLSSSASLFPFLAAMAYVASLSMTGRSRTRYSTQVYM